jgi:predicted nucleic acid-binding protein
VRSVAIYDACVLFPAPLRDLLIRIASAGIVRAHWTEQILDECFRAILQQRTDLDANALARTRSLLTQALPDCIVTGYQHHISSLNLPDENDRHALAAAIESKASIIVTTNLRDFPAAILNKYSITALHPDGFVSRLIEEHPEVISTIVVEQASALRKPSITTEQLLNNLTQCGLFQAVTRLKGLCT